MADISKCSNEQCIKRNECYRFTAEADEYWQAYGTFKPTNNTKDKFECSHWWNNKAIKTNVKRT